MKITREQLKKIIREETKNVTEWRADPSYYNSRAERSNTRSSHSSRASEFGADYDAPSRREKDVCPDCGGSGTGKTVFDGSCKRCHGFGTIDEKKTRNVKRNAVTNEADQRGGGIAFVQSEEFDKIGELLAQFSNAENVPMSELVDILKDEVLEWETYGESGGYSHSTEIDEPSDAYGWKTNRHP